jgi:hypothetical protein
VTPSCAPTAGGYGEVMARKKTLLAAAMAFASSPQGRRLIQQAREYASRPENRAKAQQALAQVRSRATSRGTSTGTSTGTSAPPYGTPPR